MPVSDIEKDQWVKNSDSSYEEAKTSERWGQSTGQEEELNPVSLGSAAAIPTGPGVAGAQGTLPVTMAPMRATPSPFATTMTSSAVTFTPTPKAPTMSATVTPYPTGLTARPTPVSTRRPTAAPTMQPSLNVTPAPTASASKVTSVPVQVAYGGTSTPGVTPLPTFSAMTTQAPTRTPTVTSYVTPTPTKMAFATLGPSTK